MIPQSSQEYTVLVIVGTYNHKLYIQDTLEGIVKQQTNFPIVACVLDDCSTDGTADIVRRYEAQYPDLIKGFYFEENQYSQGKFTYEVLIPWLGKVKYIALCEGDDYWTDPLKLQKQVDFMESHKDCTLCIHNALVKWEGGAHKDHLQYPLENKEYNASDIIRNWIVSTASVLFRSETLRNPQVMDILHDDFFVKDVALWLYLASQGKIYALKDTMCVYRRLNDGFTSNFESKCQKAVDYNFKYCLHDITIIKHFGNQFGDDFKNAVRDNYFYHNRLGMLVSIINRDMNSLKMLYLQSMSVSLMRAIGSVFIVPMELCKRFLKNIIKKL